MPKFRGQITADTPTGMEDGTRLGAALTLALFGNAIRAGFCFNYNYKTDRLVLNTLPGYLFKAEFDPVNSSDSFKVSRMPPTTGAPVATDLFVVDSTGKLTLLAGLVSTPEAWVAPSFTNSWVNFDAVNEETAGYRKQADGMVLLKGYVKSGTVGTATPMFTLPTGYRPLKTERFPVVSNGAFGYVQITTGGAVSLAAGSNVSVDISNVMFPTT